MFESNSLESFVLSPKVWVYFLLPWSGWAVNMETAPPSPANFRAASTAVGWVITTGWWQHFRFLGGSGAASLKGSESLSSVGWLMGSAAEHTCG